MVALSNDRYFLTSTLTVSSLTLDLHHRGEQVIISDLSRDPLLLFPPLAHFFNLDLKDSPQRDGQTAFSALGIGVLSKMDNIRAGVVQRVVGNKPIVLVNRQRRGRVTVRVEDLVADLRPA